MALILIDWLDESRDALEFSRRRCDLPPNASSMISIVLHYGFRYIASQSHSRLSTDGNGDPASRVLSRSVHLCRSSAGLRQQVRSFRAMWPSLWGIMNAEHQNHEIL